MESSPTRRLRDQPLVHIALILTIQSLTLLLLTAYGSIDVDSFWLPWMRDISRYGLVNGYAACRCDYPPITFVIFQGVLSLSALPGISVHLALKLALFAFLLITVLTVYFTTRQIAVAVFVQISLILCSVGLAYLDVFDLWALALGLWYLKQNRPGPGLFFYCVSCLIKFQPAIIGPIVISYLWRTRQLHLKALLPTATLLLACAVVWGSVPAKALMAALSHPSLSSQALNFYWILTYIVNYMYGHTVANIGIVVLPPVGLLPSKAAFFAAYGYVMYLGRWGNFSRFLQTACLGFLTYFVFNVGVHENHLLTAVMLSAMLAAEDRRYLKQAVIISLFTNLNLLIFYGISGESDLTTALPFVDLTISVLIVIWYGYNIISFRREDSIHSLTSIVAE